MDANLKRITHNFLTQKTGGNYSLDAFNLFLEFASLPKTLSKEKLVIEFFKGKKMLTNAMTDFVAFCDFFDYLNVPHDLKSYKVALLMISINPPYWRYVSPLVEDVRKFFLPGHQTDVFLWTDTHLYQKDQKIECNGNIYEVPTFPDVKEVFPLEPMEWPMGTLLRYDFFKQQEEKFADYDYILYIDVDMRIVNYVGDEVLPPLTGGSGLMGAQHPMYALKRELWIPYDPNPKSKAYIKRPGKVVTSPYGQPEFMPLFYAGGFQGGRTKEFIEAWHVMSKNIEDDMVNENYIALWNEQAHWNRYLYDHEPDIVLTPSYIYPDSLHKEYYFPLWGCEYPPKIMTLTKKETLKKLTPEEQARIYNK